MELDKKECELGKEIFFKYGASVLMEEVNIFENSVNTFLQNDKEFVKPNLHSLNRIFEEYDFLDVLSMIFFIKKINDALIVSHDRRDKFSKLDKLYMLYGENCVNEKIANLAKDEQSLVCSYYGIKGVKKIKPSKLSKIYDMPQYKISNLIYAGIIPKLIKLIKGEEISCKKHSILEKIILLVKEKPEEEIIEIISGFDKNKMDLFVHYFGLNNHNETAVLDLAISNNTTVNYIYQVIEELGGYLLSYYKKNTYPINNQSNKKAKIEKVFPDTNIDKILDAIKILDYKEANFFQQYYGLNGVTQLSTEEISKLYNISIAQVYSRMQLIRKKIAEKLQLGNEDVIGCYNELCKIYGTDKITDIINLLDDDLRLEAKNYIETGTIKSKNNFFRLLKKIENRVNNVSLRKSRREHLIEIYGSYDDAVIIPILDKFSELEKNIYICYYGLENNKQMKIEKIAEKFNCSEAIVRKIIYTNFLLKDIESKQVEKKIDLDSISQVKEYIEEDEISEEELHLRFNDELYEEILNYKKSYLDEVFNSLPQKNKLILKLYYGIDYGKFVSKDTIASLLNISENEIDKTIERIRHRVVGAKCKNSRIKELERKYLDIFLFYNDVEKNSVLQQLSEYDSSLFLDYFGINQPLQKLSTIYIRYAMNKYDLCTAIEELCSKIRAALSVYDIDYRKEYIGEIFGKDETKFKDAISALSTNERNLIYYYYGLNGKRKVSIEELSNKLVLDEALIEMLINKTIDKVKSIIKGNNKKI